MITEDDKVRLRSEEIFRDEVRKELEAARKNSRPVIPPVLNQPFVLWFLSSVLLGLLTFSYKQWRESQDVRATNEAYAQDLALEIRFRVRQMDLLIAQAVDDFYQCTSDLNSNNGKLSGGRIRDALNSAKEIMVAARLGGITQFPPPADGGRDTVWIGSRGYGYQTLPFKRGFKKETFNSDDIADLAISHSIATGSTPSSEERSRLAEDLKTLATETEFTFSDIIEDWQKREHAIGPYKEKYIDAYKVYELDVDDYRDELQKIAAWVGRARESWDRTKANAMVASALE